jgi:hypothetical protein
MCDGVVSNWDGHFSCLIERHNDITTEKIQRINVAISLSGETISKLILYDSIDDHISVLKHIFSYQVYQYTLVY